MTGPRSIDELASLAAAALPEQARRYIDGAIGPLDVDIDAWAEYLVLPRVLRGVGEVDTSVTLGGDLLATPVFVAPTAGHGLANPEAEAATARAAAAEGALMVYSSSATTEVTAFGAAATGPWWAQVYVLRDRGVTRDYLDRCVSAGASAVVLTVDYPGTSASPAFRSAVSGQLDALPGNYPGWTWPEMSAAIDPTLAPDIIGDLAEWTSLPVHVKGILGPSDAAIAVAEGASGVVVSNHGRRQVDGVLPTALALPEVVEAVAGAVPVTVDGGIRSGGAVLRALALGAAAVGVGRPAVWGLAADGVRGVRDVLAGLTADLARTMISVGAGSVSDLEPGLVRHRTRPPVRG